MSDDTMKPKKERFEIGLTDTEAEVIRDIATAENKAFAETLAEITRLGLPIKVSALTTTEVWKKMARRDSVYKKLVACSPDEIDRLFNLLEKGAEHD